MDDKATLPPNRRKPGRQPYEGRSTTTLRLDDDLIAWGKAKPEGLSALVRRLLRQEREGERGAR